VLFFVTENPLYRGSWWTREGHRLWASYAPDEVDQCFYIPQTEFWNFLMGAQKIPDWIVDNQFPFFWEKSNALI
jgi:hypothetical protein